MSAAPLNDLPDLGELCWHWAVASGPAAPDFRNLPAGRPLVQPIVIGCLNHLHLENALAIRLRLPPPTPWRNGEAPRECQDSGCR
jgi:hypothetical protein